MELPMQIPVVMQNAGQYFMIHGSDIPEHTRECIVKVMGPGISPVDFTVTVAECLYAVIDELNDEGREVAAQTANLAAQNGWHGMTERGSRMVNALKRANGEEVAQAVDDDPEPLDKYVGSLQQQPVRNLEGDLVETPPTSNG